MKISAKQALLFVIIAIAVLFGVWTVFQSKNPPVITNVNEPYTPSGWRRESLQLFLGGSTPDVGELPTGGVRFSLAFPMNSNFSLIRPANPPPGKVLTLKNEYSKDISPEKAIELRFYTYHPAEPSCTKTLATSTLQIDRLHVFQVLISRSIGGTLVPNPESVEFPTFIPSEKPCEPVWLTLHYRIDVPEKRDIRGPQGYYLNLSFPTSPETLEEDKELYEQILRTITIE